MVNLPCLMVSCTNFLRPTCSYTECPLSFLTGSCPTERTTASYSSCLFLDFTDLPVPQGTDIPWTLALPHFAGLCDDTVPVCSHSIVIGFLSRTLPDFGIIRNPARLWNKQCHQNVLRCNRFFLFRTSDVHQHLLRIIGCPFLQNRVDDPQKLARLWQSMTASFSADYLPLSCSRNGVL